MLEPRGTDIPILFLVFVVLPLVLYILLGKWNEATQRKERTSLLADQALQEAFVPEPTIAAIVTPVVSWPTNGIHQCARCFAPATTRCSRCKSVRYCSGKCQIIHWRQVHKHECQLLENNSSSLSEKPNPDDGNVSFCDTVEAQKVQCNVKSRSVSEEDETQFATHSWETSAYASATMENAEVPTIGRGYTDKQACEIGGKDMFRKGNEATVGSADQACKKRVARAATTTSRKGHTRQKSREIRSKLPNGDVNNSGGCYNGHSSPKSTEQENHTLQKEGDQRLDATYCCDTSTSLNSENHGVSSFDVQMELIDGEILRNSCNPNIGEMTYLNYSPERYLAKNLNKAKAASDSSGSKGHQYPKQPLKIPREHDSDRNNKEIAQINDSVTVQRSSGITSKGIMRMIGLKKSPKNETRDPSADTYIQKKLKMLFPYEDFIRFFQYQALDLSPRGLINCGNSCYANAVLQCLTCTKPLTIYLLRRSHTSSCCKREWCLMCELEQHVSKLGQSGGPLSPSRIISHVRRTNHQMGDGSQEDAHEFLRFLVASMQSICLDGLGEENTVDLKLQETTFIQHTFGGRLRSKVKCFKCHHESERYENIMDLTLEIYGWVETLEDALTQFTSPENLDGENMYRCGRCRTYVRAVKQLSIHEAPNILTIVLKRFQEGNYGKINKCITFPEMLNMIPFMTGTDDVPPLYMLYAVVVHLDTLNASFSGHYISYVKDLQGNWFRIDDSEVQPVSVNQVMSEGAYILFYTRSSPRPPRTSSRKGTIYKELRRPSRAEKSSRSEFRKSNHHHVWVDPTQEHASFPSEEFLNRNRRQSVEPYAESIGMEFSDATSSDWSIFTSSDDASFTTESTRDSFSTVDYAEAGIIDPISSIFNTVYAPEYSFQRTVACSMFSGSKPQTRFFTESKALVADSNKWRGDRVEQHGVSCTNDFCTDSDCSIHVRYGNIHLDGH
ncbi:hypothetical protein Leryth_010034 [Lithospermum erythrorhizon]|nr:hypothetical protein Leryth_010034 [Lithospermum erythrorhizon]